MIEKDFLIWGGVFVFFVVFVFLFFCLKIKKRKKLLGELEMALFCVKMPRYEKKEKGQDIKSLISVMEQIYSSFLYLKKREFLAPPPRVALEIASPYGANNIYFYIAVPRFLEKSLEKTIHGVYPPAYIERISKDYTIFRKKGVVAGSFLTLKRTFYLPILTYKNLEIDPLENIVNSLSKISQDEGGSVQIILKPLSFDFKKKGEKILSIIKEGKSLEEAINQVNQKGLIKVLKIIGEDLALKKEKEQKEIPRQKVDDATVEFLKTKLQKPALEVNIRLMVSAGTQWRAEEILQGMEQSFNQFLSICNGFEVKRLKKKKLKKAIYNFVFRTFSKKEKIILNIEELASIYHFPLFYLESPHIGWVKTKEVPPPSDLPSKGLILIGKAVYRGEEKPVYFATRNDRRRHFYIIGQTGVGKSSLLREMIRQDIEAGEGVGVIDPHGDLIEATLANIPKERIEDVILFEPFDTKRPMGLNMLEWKTPEQKDFAVSEMISIFTSMFPPEIIGPMFEHYMRNAMLALMADKENPGTLVEIPRIFTDEEFMREKVKKVTDPLVKNFWEKEWAQTTGATRSDMLGYVISKIGRFVENEMMRNIIGQSHSSFDLEEVIDNGKIFLANLSKGLTGEINSDLLGRILVGKIQMAAMRRAGMPEEKRRDFYLYIDEFQNFTTDSIVTILSEARKYRLNLILAHQFIPQLKEEIKNAVMGNVGTIASFRVGPQDAEFLEKQFEPEFSRFDLVNLDNFFAIVRMMIENKVSSPFKIKTVPPKEGNPEMVEVIKQISKLKYGRDKEEVEREIIQRSKISDL